MISIRNLLTRETLPRARGPWILDSGAFTELSLHGSHRMSAYQYARWINRIKDACGSLEWAAPQDWMCEPIMIQKTGLSVAEHQRRTIDNFLELRDLGADLVIPVIQGWTLDDYLRCVDQYAARGVRLEDEKTVGLGSVCRRQGSAEIRRIVEELSAYKIHGFGVKTSGIHEYGHLLTSSDSMAWSFAARKRGPMEGHTHRTCSGCLEYALEWRKRLLP